MKSLLKLPTYYNVDDIPVIILLDGKTVIGLCANGKPYAIGKVLVLGYPISKDEYIKLAKASYTVEPIMGDEEIKRIELNTK
jgi:hypothetical protein